MTRKFMARRLIFVLISLVFLTAGIIGSSPKQQAVLTEQNNQDGLVLDSKTNSGELAVKGLDKLKVKDASSSDGYSRDEFGSGWSTINGCDTRNIILNRDLKNAVVNDQCQVQSGVLIDPYSGKIINFVRGSSTSSAVQIDHVVALSDAWKKGAQELTKEKRKALANDPLELLAVDGPTNMQKSDGDASEWLPPNKFFRCEYVARQIAVKIKYLLWVSFSEKSKMAEVLKSCPEQRIPLF